MKHITRHEDHVWVGAMVTHEAVANSWVVKTWCPMLAQLAGGIADPQIRHVGTLGGSLANNDPAACWPAGVLGCGATVVTTEREIPADDFFVGLFITALKPGELILGLKFAPTTSGHYIKYEQPASRFALLGVAVTRLADHTVRVAVTGLGHGVMRWQQAEDALSAHWGVSALDGLFLSDTLALSDVHASASYRAHLTAVLSRRAVAHQTGESPAMPRTSQRSNGRHAAPPWSSTTSTGHNLHGEHLLPASLMHVWQALLDPGVLQICIPGCSAMQLLSTHHYQATVKVGLGPVSARFESSVRLHPDIAPTQGSTQAQCVLDVSGQAGALGRGQAKVQVQLTQVDTQTTRLTWSTQPELQGTLAQMGNRLVQASAQRLSEQFFERFARVLSGESPRKGTWFFLYALLQSLRRGWQHFFRN
jgi:carbon-monoxide dehydrogenase medium subunit